jgi:Isocitrate/isopropylmalate dehydrogenase
MVHKANILQALTGIFLETALEVGKRYEGRVQMDERIVDACAMQLVLNPWQFDVIVTTNLFPSPQTDLDSLELLRQPSRRRGHLEISLKLNGRSGRSWGHIPSLHFLFPKIAVATVNCRPVAVDRYRISALRLVS